MLGIKMVAASQRRYSFSLGYCAPAENNNDIVNFLTKKKCKVFNEKNVNFSTKKIVNFLTKKTFTMKYFEGEKITRGYRTTGIYARLWKIEVDYSVKYSMNTILT